MYGKFIPKKLMLGSKRIWFGSATFLRRARGRECRTRKANDETSLPGRPARMHH